MGHWERWGDALWRRLVGRRPSILMEARAHAWSSALSTAAVRWTCFYYEEARLRNRAQCAPHGRASLCQSGELFLPTGLGRQPSPWRSFATRPWLVAVTLSAIAPLLLLALSLPNRLDCPYNTPSYCLCLLPLPALAAPHPARSSASWAASRSWCSGSRRRWAGRSTCSCAEPSPRVPLRLPLLHAHCLQHPFCAAPAGHC